MRSFLRRSAGVLGAVVVLSSAACTDGGPEPSATRGPGVPGPPTTRLLYALSQVPATDESKGHMDFTDLEALRRVSGGKPFDRRFGILSIGVGDLAGYEGPVARLTGIDLSRATDAVRTGSPPGNAGRIGGPYDAKAIGSKLTGIGYAPVAGAPNAWAGVPDGHSGEDDPLSRLGVPTAHDLNVIRVDSGRGVVYGPRTDALRVIPAERPGRSLANEPAHRAVAGCLGAPVAAALTVDDHRSDVLGVGVTTGGSAADLREIMCVKVTGDPAATVRRLREVLRDGSAQEGTAWSKLLPGATVEQTGDGVVRLTAPSDAPAGLGILLRALFRNDLPNWRV